MNDQHVKQAIDYAANQGVDWVVLSNGAQWRVYKVIFAKPIDQELVCEFDFLNLDARDDTHLQFLFLLTKEGWAKSAVGEFHPQKQALSRFYVGAALMSDSGAGRHPEGIETRFSRRADPLATRPLGSRARLYR